jgi:hypothetical protein
MTERRAHPRYPIRKIVSYQYGERQFLTLTLDLGMGGLKIRTHECLNKGEFLNLKLILGPATIRSKGKIVHSRHLPSRECFLGIQFIDLSVEEERLLRDCLATLEEAEVPRGMLHAGKKESADSTEVGR